MMERRPKRPLSAQYLKNVYFPNGVLVELKEETTASLEKHTHTYTRRRMACVRESPEGSVCLTYLIGREGWGCSSLSFL